MNENKLTGGKATVYYAAILFSMMAAMFSIAGSGFFIGAAMADLDGMTYLGLSFTLESLFRCAIIPLAAVLGDRLLRRNLFLVGIGAFAVGSIFCAVAWSPIIMLVARSVMGLAWGLFFANGIVMLSDAFTPESTAQKVGFLRTVGFISALIAAPAAGLIIDFLDWRWFLYISTVPALLAFVLMLVSPNVQQKVHDGKRLDVLGSVFIVLALIPFSLALSWGGTMYAWGDPIIVGLFAGAIAFLIALVICERKAQEPMIPYKLLKDRNYAIVIIMCVLFVAGYSAVSNYTPTILQGVFGLTATEAAIPGMVCSLAIAVISPIIGSIYGKRGNAKALFLLEGVTLAIYGVLLWVVSPGASVIAFCGIFLVSAVGNGVHETVPQAFPSSNMEPGKIAVAVGFVNFAQVVMTSMFNAVVGALFNADPILPYHYLVVPCALMIAAALFMTGKKRKAAK